MRYLFSPIIATILLFSACSSPDTKKTVGHTVSFIKGSSNNKLEVLDWGSTGEPIVFLAGLGNSAHVFDDFAPKYTDKFHVYGLTRRGFGSSDKQATDYSIKTLALDIKAVMDSLHLSKVILIGHSIAGDEISKFASLYPERVSKVVYLDAAYDRTTPLFKQQMAISIPPPKPATIDSSSLEHWKAFSEKIYGLTAPNDEWIETEVFSKEGKYLREVAADSVYMAVINGVEPPDYKKITCPALAIYAQRESAKLNVPSYDQYNDENKKKLDQAFILIKKYSGEEKLRFKKEVHNGIAKSIVNANHYVFISNPVETDKMIREFLE